MNNVTIKISIWILFLWAFFNTHILYAATQKQLYNDKWINYWYADPSWKVTITSQSDAPKSAAAADIKAAQANSSIYKQPTDWKWTPTSASSTTNTDTTTPADPMDQASAQALEWQPSYDEAAAENTKALEAATNTQWNNSTSQDTSTDNLLWISNDDLRNGNVNMDTIPKVIINIINILLGIAGTISILSLIYYAFQMQINSGITGDSSWVDKAKKWMIGSIIGFVIAICAWFIIIKAIEILTSLGGS